MPGTSSRERRTHIDGIDGHLLLEREDHGVIERSARLPPAVLRQRCEDTVKRSVEPEDELTHQEPGSGVGWMSTMAGRPNSALDAFTSFTVCVMSFPARSWGHVGQHRIGGK